VFESSRHEVHNFVTYFLYICGFCVELCRLEPEDTWTEKQRTRRRYSRNIKDYEVLAPRKLTQDGDFLSYSLTHFYEHDLSRRRKRSLPDDSEKVHYGLTFDGKDHHVELWPKHYFISPGMMIEEQGVGASLDINNVKIR
jgi:hypothetical protein